jgi:hypothetical protein
MTHKLVKYRKISYLPQFRTPHAAFRTQKSHLFTASKATFKDRSFARPSCCPLSLIHGLANDILSPSSPISSIISHRRYPHCRQPNSLFFPICIFQPLRRHCWDLADQLLQKSSLDHIDFPIRFQWPGEPRTQSLPLPVPTPRSHSELTADDRQVIDK